MKAGVLYADDCSEGLCKIMIKYKFFKNEKELHITTSKKLRLLIKKLLKIF